MGGMPCVWFGFLSSFWNCSSNCCRFSEVAVFTCDSVTAVTCGRSLLLASLLQSTDRIKAKKTWQVRGVVFNVFGRVNNSRTVFHQLLINYLIEKVPFPSSLKQTKQKQSSKQVNFPQRACMIWQNLSEIKFLL